MFPKVELLEEVKERRKKKRKEETHKQEKQVYRVNNSETITSAQEQDTTKHTENCRIIQGKEKEGGRAVKRIRLI
jgi:hypothetical protein